MKFMALGGQLNQTPRAERGCSLFVTARKGCEANKGEFSHCATTKPPLPSPWRLVWGACGRSHSSVLSGWVSPRHAYFPSSFFLSACARQDQDGASLNFHSCFQRKHKFAVPEQEIAGTRSLWRWVNTCVSAYVCKHTDTRAASLNKNISAIVIAS